MIHVIKKGAPAACVTVDISRRGDTSLGNPFVLVEAGGTYTRDESVDAYERWLRAKLAARDTAVRADMNLLYRLALGGDLALVCFCAPKRCHGDVIRKLLYEKIDARRPVAAAR